MAAKSFAKSDSRREPAGGLIVFGYGNPGRQDDGLGPAAVEEIAKLGLHGVATQFNYQLNIEDADEAGKHDRVVFVDAAEGGPEPYAVHRVRPSRAASFTTHVMSPEVVLAICRDYYGRVPPAVLVAIRGYEFDFGEALTPSARHNLGLAVDHIKRLVRGRLGRGALHLPEAGLDASRAIRGEQ